MHDSNTPRDTAPGVTPRPASLGVCNTLEDLARLVDALGPLYVRYSAGPERDARERSTDGESGLRLPGLSVNPLAPEPWWTRPLEHWLARQLIQYRHLEQQRNENYAWVLTGREVGRGPDCEPLLTDVVPVAILSEAILEESEALYSAAFDRGAHPSDPGPP